MMNRFERVFKEETSASTSTSTSASVPSVPTGAQVTTFTHYELDPRPDLDSDHGFWVALLTLAKPASQELFGILHCLRCGGASLQQDRRSGFRILPGEWQPSDYAKYRDKYLRPNAAEVKALLSQASRSNIKDISTKAAVTARLKSYEPKLRSLGWTDKEIWSEERWDTQYGRMCSVFSMVIFDPHKEIGEITADYVEFVRSYPNSSEARPRLYKHPPGYSDIVEQTSPTQAQLFAPLKKVVVR